MGALSNGASDGDCLMGAQNVMGHQMATVSNGGSDGDC